MPSRPLRIAVHPWESDGDPDRLSRGRTWLVQDSNQVQGRCPCHAATSSGRKGSVERPMHPSTKALAPTHPPVDDLLLSGVHVCWIRTEHRRAGPCRAPIQRIATLPRADPTAPRPPASSPHLRSGLPIPNCAGRAATATPPTPRLPCPDADAIFSASPAQRRQPPVARESF